MKKDKKIIQEDCPNCNITMDFNIDSFVYICSKCSMIIPMNHSSFDLFRNKKPEAIGVKHDEDKMMLQLIPIELIEAIGTILTLGSKEYDEENWRNGLDYKRVYGACQRHLTSWFKGVKKDKKSGKSHLWHAACCIAFLITYEEHPYEYKEFDNRYIYKTKENK